MSEALPATGMTAAAATVEIGGRSVALHYGDPEREYDAARSGAVVVDRSHEGRLRATGRDRLDLLHRMSTNDLSKLVSGQAAPTVFTNALGRMVDLAWALVLPNEVLLLTSPGRGPQVRRWLSGYIFFQDEVHVEDVTGELGQLGVYGPQAASVIGRVVQGADTLPKDHWLQQDSAILLRRLEWGADGFTLLIPALQVPDWWRRLIQAGAAPAGEQIFQIRRIEAGQPYGGHEITEEVIPLEVGLWSAVSFSKGCYIGQEIIARMESRGRLAKTLVGLKLAAPVEPGAEIRGGEIPVGRVTSAVGSPSAGPIALALIKPGHATPGTRVEVGGVPGSVAEFPLA